MAVQFLASFLFLQLLRLCVASFAPKDLVRTVTVDWSGTATTVIAQGYFSPVFADYNAATAEDGLLASVQDISPLGANVTASTGYHFRVSNRADDVYFGLKGLVRGLPRNMDLKLQFDITIASSVGPDCVGIGGSPGTSVWLKAGASRTEPYALYSLSSGIWQMAGADKGQQATGGPAGSVVGDVAVPLGDCGSESAPFYIKRFVGHVHRASSSGKSSSSSSGADYVIRSSSGGNLWLLVGFESGFEGLSSLYIQKIVARFYRA